jgi:AbiV family abortive infection protein
MVSEAVLREGSWYALEQAGRLLHAADDISKCGDLATAVALAMFGREEIGRWRILQTMAEEVAGGMSFSVRDVKKRCNDHNPKQEASTISTTLRITSESELDAAVRTKMASVPGSDEWKKASKAIDLASEKKRKRDPQDRHGKRKEALYVDLKPDGNSWSRPCEMANNVAREEIEDAVNDYSLQRRKAMADARFGTPPLPPLLEPPFAKPFG